MLFYGGAFASQIFDGVLFPILKTISSLAHWISLRLRRYAVAAIADRPILERALMGTKLIGWPWVEQRCRWRMGRMNVTPSKFCMEIADLYLQVDEAVKRAVLS